MKSIGVVWEPAHPAATANTQHPCNLRIQRMLTRGRNHGLRECVESDVNHIVERGWHTLSSPRAGPLNGERDDRGLTIQRRSLPEHAWKPHGPGKDVGARRKTSNGRGWRPSCAALNDRMNWNSRCYSPHPRPLIPSSNNRPITQRSLEGVGGPALRQRQDHRARRRRKWGKGRSQAHEKDVGAKYKSGQQ